MRENGPYETHERFAAEYTLPDPLKKDDGTRITTPEEWLGGQRERILQLLQDNEYGEVLPPPLEGAVKPPPKKHISRPNDANILFVLGIFGNRFIFPLS